MPSGHHRTLVGLGTAALVLSAAACSAGAAQGPATREGSSPRAGAAAPAATSNPSPTPAGSLAPTTTGSSSGTTATARESGTATAPLTSTLLPAERMPGLAASPPWREVATRTEEGDPFGTCHRYAMTSIGAREVAVREFAPTTGSDPATAGELVADFADLQTARRAFAVLESWRGRCEELLSSYDARQVGDLQPVDVDGGDADWYLLTYGPPDGGSEDEAYHDSQGLVRVGSRVAVVRMRVVDRDPGPSSQEPMAEALRRAARELG